MPKTISDDWQNMPPVVYGVWWWNHRTIEGLLGHLPERPVHCRTFDDALAKAISVGGCLIAWSSRLGPNDDAAAAQAGVPLVRVEDGFLRSVGLGAGLVPAASLVFDGRGIYYDCSKPSDLEHMLEHADIDDDQRMRGRVIAEKIRSARLSKYNLANPSGKEIGPRGKAKRKTKILVPGQVADDASIQTTQSDTINLASDENVNIQLLREARKNNPGAYITYKPHPDVAAGLRKGHVEPSQVLQYADRIISKGDIIEAIEQCDRIETLTSLTGFEALLRGRDVTVHGLPFYAGWGLTNDTTRSPRRSRNRTIDELIYLTFVEYNKSVHPKTFQPCTPEELIDALVEMRASRWHRLKTALIYPLAWFGEKFNLQP